MQTVEKLQKKSTRKVKPSVDLNSKHYNNQITKISSYGSDLNNHHNTKGISSYPCWKT